MTDSDEARRSLTDDLQLPTPTPGGHQPAQAGPSVELGDDLVSTAGVDQSGHQSLPTLPQTPEGVEALQGEG